VDLCIGWVNATSLYTEPKNNVGINWELKGARPGEGKVREPSEHREFSGTWSHWTAFTRSAVSSVYGHLYLDISRISSRNKLVACFWYFLHRIPLRPLRWRRYISWHFRPYADKPGNLPFYRSLVISTRTKAKNAHDVICFRLNGEEWGAVVISKHFLLTPLNFRSLNGLGVEAKCRHVAARCSNYCRGVCAIVVPAAYLFALPVSCLNDWKLHSIQPTVLYCSSGNR
jgi:hypothetical protein